MAASVSVIIPTYNRAEVLDRAIASAVAQKIDGMEILVVDDGSTDPTGELVRRYDPTVVRYLHQTNRGPAGARNAGVRAATGPWLAFLDSDDEWFPGKLVAQLRQVADAGAGWAVCGHVTRTPDGREVPRPMLMPRTPLQMQAQLLANHAVATDTVLVRRRVFEQVGGFDESLRTAEDVDLYLRLAAAAPFAADDEPRCRVHITGNGTVNLCGRLARTKCLRRVFGECRSHLVARSLYRDRRHAMGREALELARLHLAEGRRLQALGWLARSAGGGFDSRQVKLLAECLLGTDRYDRGSARIKGTVRLWR